jgi:hypothetical protein
MNQVNERVRHKMMSAMAEGWEKSMQEQQSLQEAEQIQKAAKH